MAAPNLSWGGYSNGRIPANALADIGGGKLLQPDAARTWRQFAAAFYSRWGAPLYLAGYQDAYRDLARQQAMYDRWKATGLPKNGVAKAGSSIHGWARSVDCTGYGQAGSARHNWMVENAPRFGWSWKYGDELDESWHWDYVGPITTTAGGDVTPIDEEQEEEFDTMALINLQSAQGAVVLVGEFVGRPFKSPDYSYAANAQAYPTRMVSDNNVAATMVNEANGRYAKLVNDIAAAVVAGLPPSAQGQVDYEKIAKMSAAAVDEVLADDLAVINANIDDQPTEFVIVPKA